MRSFPFTHRSLYFPGFDVLPTFAAYGAARMRAEGVSAAKDAWQRRLGGLFHEPPIAFGPQNGADYDEAHVPRPEIAPGHTGFRARRRRALSGRASSGRVAADHVDAATRAWEQWRRPPPVTTSRRGAGGTPS